MTVQEIQFELMKIASFNNFDGDLVVEDLKDNPDLWIGAVMDRAGYSRTDEKYKPVISLLKLRDMSLGYWNVDTLFITPKEGKEDELFELASDWKADEVGWIGEEDACIALGSYSPEARTNKKQILRVWWD